ncbi:DUF4149 domain-containing protein [Ramlibacter albus]|uniref:DUF4149 domain-containing protein n=1 Tax=Ramlibacter albus TaxID=2079448 RepID=A0A923MCQ6_9BURK|nr:DUF4149 domain-containing protein [Ramlibacter albus]MBC5766652.1 DUF4149 domain-containing protein [Ramlibacter albus]
MKARLPVLAAALWWGSLTAIGFMAVPLLFANASSPAVAGQLAARLFTAQTYLSLGCGLVLLYTTRLQGWVLAGLILDLLIEFAAAPRIRARENLALWHGAGTAMYALQWLCALVVLWKLSRGSASSPTSASASPS